MADKDKKPKPKISKYMKMQKEDKTLIPPMGTYEIKVSRKGQPDPKPFAGGGRAMRGYGKAYMKGGRVGYKGGTLVGKYKTRTGGTGGRSK